MSGPADVAVAIVNHNTADDLVRCLASLEHGGMAHETCRVIVVDNASTDDSAARAERGFPWVEVVRSPDNLGFAKATNLALARAGFEAAAGRVGRRARPSPRRALLLNPDTVVPPGAIHGLAQAMDDEPDLGAVGPKLVLADGSLDLACRRGFPTPAVSFYRFTGLARLFPHSPRFGRYNMTHLDPDEPADVDALVGACMLVRGRAIDEVGLLDERFWMYGEDLDWCLRLHEAGWRVAYRPHVVVRHVKRASSSGSRRAHYEFQRAMWIFYMKHYATSTPRPLHWAVLAGIALRGGHRLAREMLG